MRLKGGSIYGKRFCKGDLEQVYSRAPNTPYLINPQKSAQESYMQEWIETAEELGRSIPNRSDIDPNNSQKHKKNRSV